jgi:RNA polymerase sigma-70 factor (ECF subfamily)
MSGMDDVDGMDRPATDDPDGLDRSLLDQHLAGDRAAFDTLVRRHQDRLWAVALRTLGDRDEAADAVQDALLSAYRAAGSFRGDARVSTWLHRIVVNACLDRVRRRNSRPTVPLPDDDRSPSAKDDLTNRELATDLHRALAVLPVEQRAALVLVDAQGYPLEEVARMLSVPVGTVKSRCSRGRARMALLLRDARAEGSGNPERSRTVQPDRTDGAEGGEQA